MKFMPKIYIVSTPIGNLDDITYRAIETLTNVDLILSEDTRETEKVLQKWKIKTPQISYRDENHDKVMPKILELLLSGQDLALVSDSGTPVISDPGFKLIRELLGKYEIISVPGPSALISSLSISGLPTDNFTFLGFLPRKTSQRKKILDQFGSLPSTLVIYESPYRVRRLLSEISTTLGNRIVCIAKDLTKKFEDVKTAPIENFLQDLENVKAKGEYIVLISKEGFSLKQHE